MSGSGCQSDIACAVRFWDYSRDDLEWFLAQLCVLIEATELQLRALRAMRDDAVRELNRRDHPL